tara:strand:- start:180 stop:392 length:213 start_codon:yes stop_codon:yes gene_type:complete
MIGILIPLLFIATPVEAHMGHSFPTREWIQQLRDWEAERNRLPLDVMLDDALLEFDDEMWYNGEAKELEE